MLNELEQQAAGIKQTLSAQKTAINEQPPNTLSNTRKKLLELRARMDKVGTKPMQKPNSAEESKQSLAISPIKSPKGIVVDKRKIQRDKILNKWRLLMGSLVSSMQELYLGAVKSQKYEPVERQLLSETLSNLKLAKHGASKDYAQVAGLLSKAKNFFDDYKTHRKQLQQANKIGQEHLSEDDDIYQSDLGSENGHENLDNHESTTENSDDEEVEQEQISEDDAEMDQNDSGSDKTDQDLGYQYVDHDASTEHSLYDGEFGEHGDERNSNNSGQSSEESSYHGTSITMTDYEKQSDSDQTDYYDELKTDAQYHSEVFDQESPKQKSLFIKAYSSDGELTSARKTDLSTENLKNKHRTVSKYNSDQKVIAKSADDEKTEYEIETTNDEESEYETDN
ncbi:hypothetical protein niasHT_023103 [Heterodera trifolii]|uniref:Uncharacterized protein n=1 Tax=Heterodera trifolii TaxID=157864 RepID=A0ABD2KF75_9BILA